MIFRKRKIETLDEKFTRLLSFSRSMVESSQSAISDFKKSGNVPMALSNFSHLIHNYSEIATMRWRSGQDPRDSIRQAHDAYCDMVAYRSHFDPDHQIPMIKIAGITDWDLIYSLFWLNGKSEPFEFVFPDYLSMRYFAYSRYILHRVTDTEIPEILRNAVENFHSEYGELVDQNFGDLLILLDDRARNEEVGAIVARVETNWRKRRNTKFYHSSAPLLAGHDVSNELSIDYQLACIVKKQGWHFPESPHLWRWN